MTSSMALSLLMSASTVAAAARTLHSLGMFQYLLLLLGFQINNDVVSWKGS